MKHFLIVVDMQKDFVDGALGTPEAQAIVEKVADKILGFEGQIFATLDTHRENYLTTAEGKKLPVKHCIKGTPGWVLNDSIAAALEQKGYTPVEKLTFGSVLLPRLTVYGHLCGVQCADAEGEFPGDGDFRGQRLLRRSHSGNPRGCPHHHALLPDQCEIIKPPYKDRKRRSGAANAAPHRLFL